ncbi:ABC transporter permease [Acuticoccus sp. 2012]|uniref:ABC transporter permease n=1 Tax=Acuticoccus mangrovi TaxID=2796142 RepID=A0A934IGH0_9HYPH|nr:ABC transporter permease [Acuticoccus mangrovi]
MGELLGRRAAYAVVLLAALSVAGFAILVLLPGDVAEVILTAEMDGERPSAEAVATFRATHGFDDPLPIQYVRWLGGVLTGDLGTSFATGDPVSVELALRLSATFTLVGTAFVMMLLIALPLGVAAAVWRGTLVDRILMGVSVVGMSVPNFWQSLLFVLFFSLMLGWLPSSGFGSPAHVVLPALVIATSSAGLVARFVRSSLIVAMGEPHVRTAFAKGLGRREVLLHHVAPGAMAPILTVLGLQAARMFDGAIVVETVFAWPGLGRLLVDAVMGRDYPVLQGALLLIGTATILINLLVDVAISAIDPRIGDAV